MLGKKDADKVPERIGNYKILSRLGKGGMGDIYKAMQLPLNRMVALKVLPPHYVRDEEFARRFEIEAKAISLLHHQNIVSLYEYGEEQGLRFFAMQFIDGINLARYIDDHREVPIAVVIDYARQICRALRYAHLHDVIHRDIKPQNILIDRNNIVKLSDFGIAKIYKGTDVTMAGLTMGTPEYMSPEQVLGKNIDHQTDIYSLGVVMYEMLTGGLPFAGGDAMALAYKQVHEQPPLPSAKRKDTPRRLELIIVKALKKEKEARYRSTEEMLEHLDSVDMGDAGVPLTLQSDQHAPKPHRVQERRIVDRRSNTGWLHTGGYWTTLLRLQWPSLALWALLAAAFIIHLFKYHLR